MTGLPDTIIFKIFNLYIKCLKCSIFDKGANHMHRKIDSKLHTNYEVLPLFQPTRYELVFLHRVNTASSRSFTQGSSDKVKAAATKSNCTWKEKHGTAMRKNTIINPYIKKKHCTHRTKCMRGNPNGLCVLCLCLVTKANTAHTN